MKWLPATAPAPPVVSRTDWRWIGLVGIPVILLIGAVTWYRMRRVPPVKLPAAATADDAEMENWFQNGAASTSADGHSQERPAG